MGKLQMFFFSLLSIYSAAWHGLDGVGLQGRMVVFKLGMKPRFLITGVSSSPAMNQKLIFIILPHSTHRRFCVNRTGMLETEECCWCRTRYYRKREWEAQTPKSRICRAEHSKTWTVYKWEWMGFHLVHVPGERNCQNMFLYHNYDLPLVFGDSPQPPNLSFYFFWFWIPRVSSGTSAEPW